MLSAICLLEIAARRGIMQAMMMLAGKWVWIWNWQTCEGGDALRIAARLRAAGCSGALVKAFDGPRWFDQGGPWREIAGELKANGVRAGGWGYCYGNDPASEAQRAIETARYGQADLLVLDVEAEFKGNPRAADALCRHRRICSPGAPRSPARKVWAAAGPDQWARIQ